MSSVSIVWVSRSESASKSETGTKDFLRKGEGVRVWLYFREEREVAMGRRR